MSDSKNRIVKILLPDGEKLITIRVIQCLSVIEQVKIFVLSTKRNSSVRYSRFVSKYFYIKKDCVNSWIESIDRIVETYSIDVVLPVFETSIMELVENRASFKQLNKTLIPSSLEQFENARNKWLLYNYLNKVSVPTPKTLDLISVTSEGIEYRTLNYPVLIKPKCGIQGDGFGIKKFKSWPELKVYLNNIVDLQNFILQEYFEGIDLGFNVLCNNGKILAYSIQLGTLFEDEGFKPQIGLKMIEEEDVLSTARHLLESLNWSGVAHIDFMYNPSTKKYVVLEMNTRFWLTLPASLMAGVNFPWLYCQTVIGKPYEVPEYDQIEYLTLRGLMRSVRKNPFFLLNIKTIWKTTPVRYLIKDYTLTTLYIFSRFRDYLFRRKWSDIN